MKSDVHFGFKSPLHPEDTEESTLGCRATNPDICKNYMLQGVCAFCSEDKMCKSPSKAWKKQFNKLKEQQKNGI